MKNLKKLSGILLAIAVLLACTVSAFADAGTSATRDGKITIENTVENKEYRIYKILELESFNTNPNGDGSVLPAYSYKLSTDWASFKHAPNFSTYLNVDDNDYVTWIGGTNGTDYAAFAEYASQYAADNSIAPDDSKTASANDETLVFDRLGLGYYLVQSDVGAVCSLTTTNKEATVYEKNSAPTLKKQVKEGLTWGQVNDADIGDTVEFQATITVFGVAKKYVLHDKMDTGLTYQNVTGITLNGTSVQASNYDVATAIHGDTFDVTFKDAFCATLNSGDEIVISYTAQLNDSAVVGAEGNTNTAKLTYTDDNGTDKETTATPDTKTTTKTWSVPVLKYANGDKNKTLSGAKFTLSLKSDGTDPIAFIKDGTNYRVAKPEETTGTITEIVTENSGEFTILGLDSAKYYLTETEAPVGYNKLETKVIVTVVNDGKVKIGEDENITQVTKVEVENKSGSLLPSTGGIGTTIFYIVGGVLVAAAVVLLVAKKRTSENR